MGILYISSCHLQGTFREFQLWCPMERVDPAVLSRCLQCHGENYSQCSLTKAFLPFREHDTNVTKLHEGPCKESVAVSAIEVKNPSLRAANKILRTSQIFQGSCKRSIGWGVQGSQCIICFSAWWGWIWHPPAPDRRSPHAFHTKLRKEEGDGYGMRSWLVSPGEGGEAENFSCQHAVQVGSFPSGDHKRFHPQQQGFKTPMLVVSTDVVRLIRALTINIYRA